VVALRFDGLAAEEELLEAGELELLTADDELDLNGELYRVEA